MNVRTFSKIVLMAAVAALFVSGCGSYDDPGDGLVIDQNEDEEGSDTNDGSDSDDDGEDGGTNDSNTSNGDEANGGETNGGDGTDNTGNGSSNGDDGTNDTSNGSSNGDDGTDNDSNGTTNGDDGTNDSNGGDGGQQDCTDLSDPDCSVDCRDLSTWPDQWIEDAQEVVELTNQKRQEGVECYEGTMPPVDPLEPNDKLAEAARCHSLDMAKDDYFAHESPEGSTVADRAEEAGYDWSTIGENIAAGQTTPESAVNAWLESEQGHCEGLMEGMFEDVGVGVVVIDGYVYWTQNFGSLTP